MTPEIIRSELIDKTIKAYNLHAGAVSDAVELYYDAQKLRIMHANKERAEGPDDLVTWYNSWLGYGEHVILGKLKWWVEKGDSPAEARWAYEQYGIGPVIAAGLAAHIDVTKASSISAVWKFSGFAPGYDRKVRGVKLPYNGRLKTLCWKMGESFVKVANKEGATYGAFYAQCKAEEVRKNEAGELKAQAAHELATKTFKKEDSVTKQRLLAGMLSDAHLHSRAKRKTVKLFLSHYWTVGRQARGLPIREPYAKIILGHDGIIEPEL